MEGYISDKEQIEMIKKWWSDYGKTLMLAILVGLVVGFGWRYYHQYNDQRSLQASSLYQMLLMQDQRSQPADAIITAKQLIKDYPTTPYASLANFVLAKEAVQANKLDVALDNLYWVVAKSPFKFFQQIARLRAARVLISSGRAKEALAYLQTVNDESYLPMIESLRGDAQAAMGNKVEAKNSYQIAQAGFKAMDIQDPLLEMKLAQ